MPLPHDALVKRVEEALEKGRSEDLDTHELAVLIVEYVRRPQPVHVDRQAIIAERLKEI